MEITCPDCGGSRYQKDAAALYRTRKDGAQAESLPRLMEMSVDEALAACSDLKLVASRLQTLSSLGLGYLTLGEATPSLSGGEAQRLKLASEMGKGQADTVFVFDEPTIGLHPLDVRTLLGVFQRLIDSGATVVVIEHDLDVIRNADLSRGPWPRRRRERRTHRGLRHTGAGGRRSRQHHRKISAPVTKRGTPPNGEVPLTFYDKF